MSPYPFYLALLSFLLFVLGIAEYEGFLSSGLLDGLTPQAWAVFGILAAIAAIAIYSRESSHRWRGWD